MPKKFRGENSKAVVARARKAAAADAVKAQKDKAVEDAYWADDDKSVQRKQNRKAEKEQKKAELLTKKREREELYNTEMESIKSAKPVSSKPSTKVTRAQIMENAERESAEKTKKVIEEDKVDKIEENVNQILADHVAQGESVEARSVSDAISLLSVGEELDRHPERRMKAAYTKYEDDNFPRLKREYPNLRMSQLRQMLKKEWVKSPENPMNQRFVAYNAKK